MPMDGLTDVVSNGGSNSVATMTVPSTNSTRSIVPPPWNLRLREVEWGRRLHMFPPYEGDPMTRQWPRLAE